MSAQSFGYHNRILHLDLEAPGTHAQRGCGHVEEPEPSFMRLYAGGGLLATCYLLRETKAGIDALGPENLLIFASSVVAGHPAAGLPRFAVCAKSPLTGGIGEARSEGPWGVALKASGVDAVVCRGRASAPVGVLIEDGRAEFFDADDLWGKSVGETTDALEARFGTEIHVAAIGPAGENRVRFASVVSDRTHQAARMGMGAVMGAKNLKAVVLRGHHPPPLADPEGVAALTRWYAEAMRDNPLATWQLEPPGFAVWVHTHGIDAALDVENYRRSELAEAENYCPALFMAHFQGVAACPGCPNDCIKRFHVDDRRPTSGRS